MLLGAGGVEMARYVFGPRPTSVILMSDLRFLYDDVGMVIDSHNTDQYGNDVACWKTTISHSDDMYYAIPPFA